MTGYATPVNRYLSSIDIAMYERYVPTAFNDSLSLLEKVNKVIFQLNETNKLSNEIVDKWNDFTDWANSGEFLTLIESKINEMLSDDTIKNMIDTELLASIRKEMTDLKTTTNTFKMESEQRISEMQESVLTNETIVNNMEGIVSGLNQNMGSLKTDVSTLKTDVGTLKTDASNLKTTTGTHTTDISNLKTTTGTHTTDISNLKTTTGTQTSDINTLKTTTGTHTTDISNLKTTTGTHTTEINNLKNVVNDTGWVTLTLLNGVVPNSASSSPQVRKLNGVVYIRGSVKNITAKEVIIATLPTQYRPLDMTHVYLMPCSVTNSIMRNARWSVETDGSLKLGYVNDNTYNANDWFPLSTSYSI